MKIYLFNPDSGVYLGEDFSDDQPIGQDRCSLPSDATAIAPPPYKSGEVPVFRSAENRWRVAPVAALAKAAADAGSLRQARRPSKPQTLSSTPSEPSTLRRQEG
jgi:hypothetical protein